MKKSSTCILLIVIISIFLLPGCATLFLYKKDIFLIDKPADLVVMNGNDTLEIAPRKVVTYGSTDYMYPGVHVRLKKNLVLQLKSGDSTVFVPVKRIYKSPVGIFVFAFFEAFLTCGVGTIIDFATGSFKESSEALLDVPAKLKHKEPRSQKQLEQYINTIISYQSLPNSLYKK